MDVIVKREGVSLSYWSPHSNILYSDIEHQQNKSNQWVQINQLNEARIEENKEMVFL